jgi:hypothetical protein
MKVWGDFTDPDRTLRGESREVDLLNVRYLLARSSSAPVSKEKSPPVPEPVAVENFGGQTFAKDRLNLPGVVAGERISFQVPPTETDHIALTTTMAWSDNVPDHTVVARIHLRGKDGQRFEFALLAGDHTSEWAHDRVDVGQRIKHKRAPIASSYVVDDPMSKYEGHEYLESDAHDRSHFAGHSRAGFSLAT